MVNHLDITHSIYTGARKFIKPTSFEGLKYIPKNLEQDIVTITNKPQIVGVPLDKSSEACEFFGVDSYENLVKQILNHEKLYKAKYNWHIKNYVGYVLNMQISMTKRGIENFKNNLTEPIQTTSGTWSRLKEFDTNYTARLSCYSEIFGKDPYGCPNIHTIGLVKLNGNLYILDSLGEQTPQLKEFHQMLKSVFQDLGYHKIIFSTKPQQPMTEFTCNNWTYANIEATLNAILEKRFSINTPEELNKILPENINEILTKQQTNVIWTD